MKDFERIRAEHQGCTDPGCPTCALIRLHDQWDERPRRGERCSEGQFPAEAHTPGHPGATPGAATEDDSDPFTDLGYVDAVACDGERY